MNFVSSVRRVRWKERAKLRSRKAVAAKASKRMEGAHMEAENSSAALIPPRAKYATVSIRIGRETASFRVFRFSPKQLFALGKIQAASTVGRRLALVLDNLL